MTKSTARGLLLVLTLTAALLRVPGLNSDLWFDEVVTLVESVRLPLWNLLTAFPGNNNHPFYSLLAHAAVSTFGESPRTVRLPAFLFGVACVPMLYLFARQITNRTEALLAAVLFAVSYHAVWFSQNARGYTVLLFFTLLASWLFIKALMDSGRRLSVAYGVAAGLGIYTHLTMVFVVAAHAAIWAWSAARSATGERARHVRTGVEALGTAAVVSGLLYLPMASDVYAFFSGPPQATAAIATPKWAIFEVLRGLRIGFGAVGILAALALVIVGLLDFLRRAPLLLTIFLLPAILTAGTMLTMGAPLRPRFFFALAGFALIVLVRGAMESGRVIQRMTGAEGRRADAFGLAIVMLIGVASTWSLRDNYRYPKQDFSGPRAYIETHRRAGEPVATSGLARYPYARYWNLPWTPIERAQELERLRAKADRVWVVYSFPEYMDAGLVEAINEHCKPEAVFHGTLGGGDVMVCATTSRTS